MDSFCKYFLEKEDDFNPFNTLCASADFEPITLGRKGANLVDMKDNIIPLVRTTTRYQKPNQKMLPIHHNLLKQIQNITEKKDILLNNALIEMYDNTYYNMGYHSDQALDLDDSSFICLFSCYNNPSTKHIRKLRIKEKATGESFDIVLDHNSIVIFSVDTNSKYWHKIIFDYHHNQNDNDTLWLGVTFRQSKTFIYFKNEIPYFYPQKIPLTLATDIHQQKEFYKNRAQENANSNFIYPDIFYTLSVGDIIPIL